MGVLYRNLVRLCKKFNEVQEKILQYSSKEQEIELDELELDESYFGTRREVKEGVGQLARAHFGSVKKER